VVAEAAANTGRPSARFPQVAAPFPTAPGPNHAGTFQRT
jgi:hypothetical protein